MISKGQEKQIQSLPIYKSEREFIDYFTNNTVTILTGETGSGKTTQIPKILLSHKLIPQQVVITQPRRVAAISIAHRVSEELNTTIGDVVGYSVRFQEKSSKYTKIKYVTDGMLVRECILDPLLTKYSVVIIDEVHERSVHTDILLAILKGLISGDEKKRPDLKVVIMSATFNAKKFLDYFNTKAFISVMGRTFPVKVYNVIKENASYIDMALSCVMQIIMDDNMEYGDILVFLPGQEDIEDLSLLLLERKQKLFEMYNNQNKKKIFEVYQLFSSMPYEAQMKVFLPSSKRKVILATNIAETSITIKNVKYIVDTGKFKIRKFFHNTNTDTLTITDITKNSALQRAGRAGRDSEGACFRLYSKEKYNSFNEYNEPEILRINLRNVILELMAIGFPNIDTIDFIDKPKKENYQSAYDDLISLKALNRNIELTDFGRKIAILPVEPAFAVVLLNSLKEEFSDVSDDIMIIVSLLQSDNIFYTPSTLKEKIDKIREKFINPISDHLTLLNVYIQWKESENKGAFCKENYLNDKALRKTKDIYDQLKKYLTKIKIDDYKENKEEMIKKEAISKVEKMINVIEKGINYLDNEERENRREELICKCLLTGFFDNIARYSNENFYSTVKGGMMCKVHPTSILIKKNRMSKEREFLLYNEMIVTSKRYLKCCTLLKEDWVSKYINKNNYI